MIKDDAVLPDDVTAEDFLFPPVTALDRCDACSAAARTRVVVTVGEDTLDLLFCNHHYNQHAPALVIQGFTAQLAR